MQNILPNVKSVRQVSVRLIRIIMKLSLNEVFFILFISIGFCHGESGTSNTSNSMLGVLKKKRDKFKHDWQELSERLLPEWYDKAKIGIMVQWGVYSVPGYGSEWIWYHWKNKNRCYEEFMNKTYPPGFSYEEFAPMFKAEFFSPKFLAELFAKAGAKYVVLSSKHHDGFSLFPSKNSFAWNSVDVGPHRDIIGELSQAIRLQGLKFGVHYSLYEWYNPLFLSDQNANFRTYKYVESKLWPDIQQLILDYKPSVFWSDGDWAASDKYWRSEKMIAWMYNESPVKKEIVVNDRWGKGSACRRGDFYTCEDRYNPGKLQPHKWENAFSLDYHSWGYRKNLNIEDVMPIGEILQEVFSTVTCGGNVLINVGPTQEGTISPIFQERLRDLGEWLEINGEAIYGSSPWVSQKDSQNGDVWYTCKREFYNAYNPTAKPNDNDTITAIYAMFTYWPNNKNNTLSLSDITQYLNEDNWLVRMLGNEDDFFHWEIQSGKQQTVIFLPRSVQLNSKYAWTIKFTKDTAK